MDEGEVFALEPTIGSSFQFKFSRTVLLAFGLAISLAILLIGLRALGAANAERKTIALYTALQQGDYSKVGPLVQPETVEQLRGLDARLGKVRSFEWIGVEGGLTPPFSGRARVTRGGRAHVEKALIDSSGKVYVVIPEDDH